MLNRMYNENYDLKMDRKMKEKNDKIQTLEMEFNDNEYIEISFSTRVHSDVPKNESATGFFRVMLHGMYVKEVLNVDYKVRIQSAIRNSFDDQNDFIDFVDKHATKDKPYHVHFNDMSKRIVTPEIRKARIIRGLKETGMSMEELRKALGH